MLAREFLLAASKASAQARASLLPTWAMFCAEALLLGHVHGLTMITIGMLMSVLI